MRTALLLTASAGLLASAGCGSPSGKPASVGPSKVSGFVYMPVAGAIIDVYRPAEDLRGPPFTQLGPVGPRGDFTLDLPAGEYIFVARKRQTGEETGPIREGDIKTDPVRVRVEEGKPLAVNLEAYRKEGNPKERLPPEELVKGGVAGRVLDPEGNPMVGVRVHIYDHVQMSERPKYVSAKTGPDGRYEVRIPKGGTYYVCARDKYGGPPKVGDLYGRYDKGTVEPSAVIVPEGELVQGVDVTVHKVW